jgi:hypothetical protein
MLMALLYRDDGRLLAAAPACDQQPFGDGYWEEVCSEYPSAGTGETAYVEISDPDLVNRLLGMDFSDDLEAAEAVDAYLGLSARTG